MIRSEMGRLIRSAASMELIADPSHSTASRLLRSPGRNWTSSDRCRNDEEPEATRTRRRRPTWHRHHDDDDDTPTPTTTTTRSVPFRGREEEEADMTPMARRTATAVQGDAGTAPPSFSATTRSITLQGDARRRRLSTYRHEATPRMMIETYGDARVNAEPPQATRVSISRTPVPFTIHARQALPSGQRESVSCLVELLFRHFPTCCSSFSFFL